MDIQANSWEYLRLQPDMTVTVDEDHHNKHLAHTVWIAGRPQAYERRKTALAIKKLVCTACSLYDSETSRVRIALWRFVVAGLANCVPMDCDPNWDIVGAGFMAALQEYDQQDRKMDHYAKVLGDVSAVEFYLWLNHYQHCSDQDLGSVDAHICSAMEDIKIKIVRELNNT